MLNWINFFLLIISTVGMTFFYIKSVGPEKLSQKIGPKAYRRSAYYRISANLFQLIIIINYVLYFYLPSPVPFPRFLHQNYSISVVLGLFVLIPSFYILVKGVKDAGRETLFPDKAHSLYRGIYLRIRHPQAIGEVFTWISVALLLNSPFLFLYSIVWFPLFYWFSKAEEKDLILRYGPTYIEYKSQTGMFLPKKRQENK
ncbi:MAG: methyltransferase family protein [Promethearchaeota archaeon]|jgi:protein-S-isoprenylcysteine O-methyltransferase Ste14